MLRRRPANSRKFELWLFYIFNLDFTDFILQILIFILQILHFYFTDFILHILFYRFYFTLQISFSILQTLFYSFVILKIITDIELYCSEYSATTTKSGKKS